MTNMNSMSLLLPFCQYLRHRVQSTNLEVLHRVVTQFLLQPSCFETVDEMVRQAFPFIAILPMDHPEPEARARADVILRRMHLRDAHQKTSEGIGELRIALATKVELTNWDWLEQIFEEFCMGVDHCLREFIAIQQQAIAIVPVQPTIVLSPVTVDVSTSRLIPPSIKPSIKPKSKKLIKKRSDPTHDDERALIYQALCKIEKQCPWETIFDVSKIQYPFDATAYPKLAQEFKTFWERHAYAVWERMFWFSYGSPRTYPTRQEDRKYRQDMASRSFERVMVHLYDVLGPEYFVDLDFQSTPHYWWWFRGPAIDIVRMGHERCLKYLETGAYERHPNPPHGFEMRPIAHSSECLSFWAALSKFQQLRAVTSKLKKERLAKRS